jgi:hypothetical protein
MDVATAGERFGVLARSSLACAWASLVFPAANALPVFKRNPADASNIGPLINLPTIDIVMPLLQL